MNMKSETNRPAMTPIGRLQPRRQFLRRLGWLLAIWGVAAYLLLFKNMLEVGNDERRRNLLQVELQATG